MDPKNLKNLKKEDLISLLEATIALEEKAKFNKLKYIYPLTGPLARSKYPKHMRIMDAGAKYRFRAFMGGNRCLRYDTTKVCMADGSKKPLSEVVIGDKVLAYDIKTKAAIPVPVLQTYHNGLKEVFRITFSDGTFVDATGNHLMPRKRRSGRYLLKRGKKIPNKIRKQQVKDLKVGYRLLSPEEIQYKSQGKITIAPYVLGAMLGDGSLHTTSKILTNIDQPILERVGDAVELHKIPSSKYGYNVVQGWHGSKKGYFSQQLADLNLEVRGEYKFIPKAYLTASVEDRLQLLAGLIDTDGSKNEFVNKSERLAKDFCFLVKSLGGKATVKEVTKTCVNNGVQGQYWRVYWRLNREIPLSLTRKHHIPKRPVEYSNRIIRKIESLGEHQTGCLEIAHSDHCFLVNDNLAVGNSGKSFWLATEIAFHATGEYPDWWKGKKFKNIRAIWIVAESGPLFRDSLQKTLFGDPGEDIGTGLLPKADKNNGIGILTTSALQGVPGAIGTCVVRHKRGQTVQIVIKTNEMSREQFQAAKLDVIAFDEEPREEIYNECVMRLMATPGREPGMAMMAFTPMKGFSSVVKRFLPDGTYPEHGIPFEDGDRFVERVDWADVPHLTPADKQAMLMEISPNERLARSKGIPMYGSGLIYPVDEDFITVKPFQIPDYWPRAFGLDYGWLNTACIWITEDPATKTRYIYSEYKRGNIVDDLHIENIKAKGTWIPGADDPHSGNKDDGSTRHDYFCSKGLDLTSGVQNSDSTRARILAAFETGALKLFTPCQEFKKELLAYHYDPKDPNKPAKNQQDHLLDALGYIYSQFEYIAKSREWALDREFNSNEDEDNSKSSRDDLTGY